MPYQPPPQQAHLVSGHKLDRYELLYPLAQGGMATVWVARLQGKHGFEKLVAIKTILPQYADDPEFQTMFLDEARLAARIRHPNVAEILDIGEENGTTFLVMEWVEGDSLARLYNAVLRANKRFPLAPLLRVMADACAGLHAAHELRDEHGNRLGVVHRDVSPQNILVGANGVTKLIDFGVAKAAQRITQETSAGLVKGKIQYASPEQAMGRPLDCRSDVWAIGTVLYQMLSGRLPYEAENQLAALHMLTAGQPPKPLPPSVPPPVAAIVKKALSFRVEERYATAEEMQRALEAIRPQASGADVARLVAEFLADRASERKRDVADAVAALSSKSARVAVPAAMHTPSSPSAVVAWSSSRTPMPVSPRGPMASAPQAPPPPPPRPSSGSMPQAAPPRPNFGATLPIGAQNPFAGTLPIGATMPRPAPPAPPMPQAPPPAPPMPPQQAAPAPMAPAYTPAPIAPTFTPAPVQPLVAPQPAMELAPVPPTAASSASTGSRLRPVHYGVGAVATLAAAGVWAFVGMVMLRGTPSEASTARAPGATTEDTKPAQADKAAPPKPTEAPPEPAKAPEPKPEPAKTAEPAPAPVASAPAPAPEPAPAPQPPAAGAPAPPAAPAAAAGNGAATAAAKDNAATAAPPKSKKAKKKVDDGF